MSTESTCNCGDACGAECEDQCNLACENACEDACEATCAPVCESCGDSCSAACEERCNDICNQMCDQMCQNMCDSACSSSTSTEFIFNYLYTILTVSFSLVVLGLIQSFNSKGPILITLLGSCLLATSLTGIRFNSNTCKINTSRKNEMLGNLQTKIWKYRIIHSHHNKEERENGHEFKIRNKSFCTGCYGILLGTLISIIIFYFYLFATISTQVMSIVPYLIPICFIPIIIRYTVFHSMKTPLRLISNALLPIGCTFLLLTVDFTFNNWLLNVTFMILIAFIAYVRSVISKNK